MHPKSEIPPVAARPFPWEKSYPGGKGWDQAIKVSTICEQFEMSVKSNAGRCAIEFRDRQISYQKLGNMVDQAARGFIRMGVRPQDSIALYLPNTPWHPVAFYAALKVGAKVVLLSPLDAERTLLHKLADSAARVLVTTNTGQLPLMAGKLAKAGALDTIIIGEDSHWGDLSGQPVDIPDSPVFQTFENFTANTPQVEHWPDTNPEDIALLQYTGGTTGMPKAAILTHACLTAAVAQYDAWFECQKLGKNGDERVIGVLPLFHIYALTVVLLQQIKNGNTILLHMRFDVETVLRDIETKHATHFPGVPTMWIAFTNFPGIETRNLSSLRQCNSGGASVPVEIEIRFRKLTGLKLSGGWGMTELSPAGSRIPGARDDKHGTIGIPMPQVELGVVSLTDPHKVLGIGEIGELRVKGPNVTKGYWNRPDDNATCFVDGYFLTGDIGYMDADGYFFIVDRKKDMIISGGFNVYPQMIEQAIYEHPSVSEVLVVGVPDSYRGEAAKAVIALRQGALPFTLDVLREFLKTRLGPHELPALIEFRDALPKTAVGKLSKLDLKNELKKQESHSDD